MNIHHSNPVAVMRRRVLLIALAFAIVFWALIFAILATAGITWNDDRTAIAAGIGVLSIGGAIVVSVLIRKVPR